MRRFDFYGKEKICMGLINFSPQKYFETHFIVEKSQRQNFNTYPKHCVKSLSRIFKLKWIIWMTYVWRHPSWAHTINRFTLVWSCVGCKNVESKLASPRSRVTIYSKLSNEFRTFLYKSKYTYLQIKSLNDNIFELIGGLLSMMSSD